MILKIYQYLFLNFLLLKNAIFLPPPKAAGEIDVHFYTNIYLKN